MRAAFSVIGLALAIAAPARAAILDVTVSDVTFTPASISAHVGDTIVWTNKDIVAHSATNRDKSWDLLLLPGKSKKLVLKAPGEIDYYCKFHPNMTGHISVK